MGTTYVTGRVVEAGTGRPIVDAQVCDAFPRRYPDEVGEGSSHPLACQPVHTDLDGSFALPVYRPGHAAFCIDAFGDTVARINLACDARARIDITVEVDTAGRCEPAYDVIRGEFTGRYTCGVEMSRFQPDGEAVVDTSGADRPFECAWVQVRDDEACLHDRLEAYRPHWIRCVGDIIGPGRYGHFGMSRYLLVVREILEIHAFEGPTSRIHALAELIEEELRENPVLGDADEQRPPPRDDE